MSDTVRTRFAPSPTGFMHVGGVRTALFAWLVARKAGKDGTFILRIEDTDQVREVEGSTEHIQESLKWLGINWDEGPIFQSDRLDVYKRYADQLVREGKAYADPYTADEIEAFRNQAKANKKAFLFRDHRPDVNNIPSWDGTKPLRLISHPTSWNIRDDIMPPANEKFMGHENYPPEAIDDFILMKSDGFPTYNFAHIIDDHEMGITHVIRGQEFLASMPKYFDLYTTLGFEIPHMCSLPHVLAEGGKKKLGKRDGAKDILSYREEGYLPEAMLNFLATLGWNDGSEQEVFTVDELIEKFNLNRVQKSGAQFDEKRLEWMNGQHIRLLSLDDLSQRVEHFWPESARQASDEHKKQVLGLVQDRLKTLADLPILTDYFFTEPTPNWTMVDDNKQLSKFSKEELKDLLTQTISTLETSEFTPGAVQETLNQLLETTGQKPGILFSLIRLAVSWAPFSPALNETLAVLGRDATLQRLHAALGDTA